MIQALIYIVLFYFLLGGIAIFVINKKNKSSKASERWTKYFYYLVIVSGVIACIHFGYLPLLALVILGIGLYEVFRAWKRSLIQKKLVLLFVLILYSFIGVGFYKYASSYTIDVLLYVYTIVFVFDGFAQIIGQLLGKRKIFPSISPDKTLAGIIGGYISVLITTYLLKDILEQPIMFLIKSTFIIATAAMIGDLLASLWKRKCKIKDYSRLIPGHGGVLDRFDSYLLAGAVYYWLFIGFYL